MTPPAGGKSATGTRRRDGGDALLPLHLLEKSLGSRVELTLTGDRKVTGSLAGFDEHLNVVLSDGAEVSGGKERPLGTVVVRGNHVVSVGLE